MPVEKGMRIEHAAQVVLISTIITHADVQRQHGSWRIWLWRKSAIDSFVAGTQVTDEQARTGEWTPGSAGDQGIDVASFVVRHAETCRNQSDAPTGDSSG